MTREEAIKELSYIADEMPSMECRDWKEAICMAIQALQEPKTGHWIKDGPSHIDPYSDVEVQWYVCSKCHIKTRNKSNFCPNCGAKMEGEEE